jgi:hypothetical protein
MSLRGFILVVKLNPWDHPQVSGDEKTLFVSNHLNDVNGSRSKWEVHMNVSSLNGCFFNFDPSPLGSSSFHFAKE